ncbi:MAG: hypothetical protein WD025_05890 [Bacteriovoracaceae bacterium]
MGNKTSFKHKILFIFLLVLGNALMALFTLGQEPPPPPPESGSITRNGYVSLKVKAKLKAPLDPGLPVVCVGEDSGLVVKNAFVIKEYRSDFGAENFLKERVQKEYLVSLPKEEASKMLRDETFAIFPHGLEIENKKKETNYEIIY